MLSLTTKAQDQDQRVLLPDSVGKYLYECLVNRVDLRQSDQLVCESEDTNGLIERLNNLAYEFGKYKLDPQTTKYYFTFFQINSSLQYTTSPFELYVTMIQGSDTIALQAFVGWDKDHWQIERVNEFPFFYFEENITQFGFQNRDGQELQSDSDFVLTNSHNLKTNPNLSKEIVMPYSFSEKIVELISNDAAFGDDSVFLTRQQFLDTEGELLYKVADKLLKSNTDLGQEKAEMDSLHNNPGLLYDKLISDWGELSKRLKKKLGDLKKIKIDDIEIQISNWTSDASTMDNPLIYALINIPLSNKKKESGIYVKAVWVNDTWKVARLSGGPYVTDAFMEMASEKEY